MADARKSNPQHAGLRVTCFCTLWRYCQVSDRLPTVTTCAIGSSTNARLMDRMHSLFVLAGSYAIAAVSMEHFALNTSSIVETQRLVSAFGLDVSRRTGRHGDIGGSRRSAY
jgi:AAHS family 4-hydroxybenzoate transporter-like MFS transporter